MDLEKYKNDGWGLSKPQLQQLLNLIEAIDKPVINVVEFGSGKSTEFLSNINLNLLKTVKITSFDDNEDYAYRGNSNNVDLKIRNLLECSDSDYNKMFESKSFIPSVMVKKESPLSSRQKNNFYEILDGDLKGVYDLMILDGPNGNGRNIAFLHMKKHLSVDSLILIDDYTHYDFMEKLSLFFEYKVIHKNQSGLINQWDNGGNYYIVRVTNIL
jgi:hypothetical protein